MKDIFGQNSVSTISYPDQLLYETACKLKHQLSMLHVVPFGGEALFDTRHHASNQVLGALVLAH